MKLHRLKRLFKNKQKPLKHHKQVDIEDLTISISNENGYEYNVKVGKSVRKGFNIQKHNGWGNSISFDGGSFGHHNREFKILGHSSILSQGDFLFSEMQSGKIGVFVIHKLRYAETVHDQFFGQSRLIGYNESEGNN